MRDFRAFVRSYVEPLALPRHRELEIVEELVAQLEDSYESLLARGLSDEEAWNELQRHVPDWKTLGAELLDAEPAIVRFAQPARESRAATGIWGLVPAIRREPASSATSRVISNMAWYCSLQNTKLHSRSKSATPSAICERTSDQSSAASSRPVHECGPR